MLKIFAVKITLWFFEKLCVIFCEVDGKNGYLKIYVSCCYEMGQECVGGHSSLKWGLSVSCSVMLGCLQLLGHIARSKDLAGKARIVVPRLDWGLYILYYVDTQIITN